MKALEEMKIWICWNWSSRKGKRTKDPIGASGCITGTSEEYCCTWVTKAEAEKAAEDKGYSGIGFVLPEGFFFLDIDKRELEDPFVQMMLERFDSYAETSVSGSGIHIYDPHGGTERCKGRGKQDHRQREACNAESVPSGLR